MKNKFRLTVAILLVTLVASLFSGCFLFEDIQSISLVGQPKTQYKVGEELDTDSFKIKLQYKTSANDKEVGYYNNINVEFENNFSSAKVGTYKCVINIKGNSNISLSFDYSVVEGSVFEEGDGSQSNPYIVTTAAQFAKIGAEAGKYYELGNNISLVGSGYNDKFNRNNRSFVFDGQGYTIDIGGKYAYAFEYLNNATVKNLVLKVRPGSYESVLSLNSYNEVTFENITTKGTMEAEGNTAMLGCTVLAKKVTVKDCVNEVNFTGNATYCAAFIGQPYDGVQEITFDHCTNKGNLEGTTTWMFIANNAQRVGKINVINNCKNEGKFTSAGNGLFNYWAYNAKKSYLTLEDYASESKASNIKTVSVTANRSDFVAISKLVDNAGKDILVNENGTVKFTANAKTMLDAEFGANGYTVVAKVRDWVKVYDNSIDYQTVYFYTDAFGMDFAAPYAAVTLGTEDAETPDGALKIVDGKLVLAKTLNGKTIKLNANTNSQYYCYYIYNAQGEMKYCGQIAYKDIKNA